MRRSAAVLAAFLLLVVACGDDGDEGSGDTTTTTGTADTTTSTDTTAPPTSTTEVPADEPPVVMLYETSFGECAGFCTRTLTFDGADVALVALFTPDDLPHRITGTLTEGGVDTLADGLVDLDIDTLQEVYGCPDCADGGAARVVLRAGDRGRQVTYDYRIPPAELAVVDGVGEAVLDALVTCQANAVAVPADDCIPLPL